MPVLITAYSDKTFEFVRIPLVLLHALQPLHSAKHWSGTACAVALGLTKPAHLLLWCSRSSFYTRTHWHAQKQRLQRLQKDHTQKNVCEPWMLIGSWHRGRRR